MENYFLLSLGIALTVSIGWIVFIYRLDTYNKEPIGLLVKLFFIGILVSIPAGFINSFNLALFGMLGTLLLVGFVEEGGKYLGVRYGAFYHKAFDEPIDGVIYASMVALGFAFSENIDYNLTMLSLNNDETIPGLIARGFTPFLHVLISGVWGMQMAYYKKNIIPFSRLMFWLFIAAVFHSLYDVFVGVVPYLMIAVLFAGALYFMRKITHLNRISPFNDAVDIVCPQCNAKTAGNSLFCGSCGTMIESNVKSVSDEECAYCGAPMMPEWNYCNSCGKASS